MNPFERLLFSFGYVTFTELIFGEKLAGIQLEVAVKTSISEKQVLELIVTPCEFVEAFPGGAQSPPCQMNAGGVSITWYHYCEQRKVEFFFTIDTPETQGKGKPYCKYVVRFDCTSKQWQFQALDENDKGVGEIIPV